MTTDIPALMSEFLYPKGIGTIVRCFFEGKADAPDPIDLRFARVPYTGETVVLDDVDWRVVRVTWAIPNGPYIHLSYVA